MSSLAHILYVCLQCFWPLEKLTRKIRGANNNAKRALLTTKRPLQLRGRHDRSEKSSPGSRGAGYQAAQLLDRMMRGAEMKADSTLLSPLGIAERQSTDIYAIDDTDLATALRFIREHACDGITIGDVLRVVPLSRRMLEHRFQQVLHRRRTRKSFASAGARGTPVAGDRSTAFGYRPSRRLCQFDLFVEGF